MTTQDEEQYWALAVWGIRQDRARGPWGLEDVAYVQYNTIIQKVSKTENSWGFFADDNSGPLNRFMSKLLMLIFDLLENICSRNKVVTISHHLTSN